MSKLTAENVEAIFRDCLFREGEDTSTAIVAEGIMRNFGFHPERLASHKAELAELLLELPEQFRADGGGGWSFLQACETKHGGQWGEHANMEQLFVLGIASEQAKYLTPRHLWRAFPGGMPYIIVTAKAPEVAV